MIFVSSCWPPALTALSWAWLESVGRPAFKAADGCVEKWGHDGPWASFSSSSLLLLFSFTSPSLFFSRFESNMRRSFNDSCSVWWVMPWWALQQASSWGRTVRHLRGKECAAMNRMCWKFHFLHALSMYCLCILYAFSMYCLCIVNVTSVCLFLSLSNSLLLKGRSRSWFQCMLLCMRH